MLKSVIYILNLSHNLSPTSVTNIDVAVGVARSLGRGELGLAQTVWLFKNWVSAIRKDDFDFIWSKLEGHELQIDSDLGQKENFSSIGDEWWTRPMRLTIKRCYEVRYWIWDSSLGLKMQNKNPTGR